MANGRTSAWLVVPGFIAVIVLAVVATMLASVSADVRAMRARTERLCTTLRELSVQVIALGGRTPPLAECTATVVVRVSVTPLPGASGPPGTPGAPGRRGAPGPTGPAATAPQRPNRTPATSPSPTPCQRLPVVGVCPTPAEEGG